MTRCLIVEEGNAPYVLAAARSLARAGHHVALASPFVTGRAQASRAVHGWHGITPPEQDFDAFITDLEAACHVGGYEVVFGADDIEILALSAGRGRLSAAVPLAPHDEVLRSIDKLTLARAASSVGLAVPETTAAGDVPWEALTFPLVVKSRLHWTPGAVDAPRHLLRHFAADAASARRHVAEIEASGGAAVLQQVITGEQIAISVVVDADGRTRTASQQRTELAASDGSSIRASTTAIDRELLEGVERLLRDLRWTGLANVQFLVDPEGVPRLIDLNGRFYGSLALAVGAGADLPAAWVDVAMGRDTGPRTTARPGVRFTSLEHDLSRIRRLEANRTHELAAAATYAVGAVHQTWSWTDPLPAAVALAERFRIRGSRTREPLRPAEVRTRAARTRWSSSSKTASGGDAPSTTGTPSAAADTR